MRPNSLMTTETEADCSMILARFKLFGERWDGSWEELEFSLNLWPESAIQSAWDLAINAAWIAVSPTGRNWYRAKLVEVTGCDTRKTVYVTQDDYLSDQVRYLEQIKAAQEEDDAIAATEEAVMM